MRKERMVILVLLVIIIILTGININLILRNNLIIKNNKQIIKEMTESEYDNQIAELNKSHTDYAEYVQRCKTTIATAITDMGVQTSSNDTVDTMANNIKNISSGGLKIKKCWLPEPWNPYACLLIDTSEYNTLYFYGHSNTGYGYSSSTRVYTDETLATLIYTGVPGDNTLDISSYDSIVIMFCDWSSPTLEYVLKDMQLT